MTVITRGNPGLAAGVDTENFKQFDLFLSDEPGVFVTEHRVEDTATVATYALYSVVKFTATGGIDGLADNVSGSHADGPRGILAMTVTTQTSTMRGGAAHRRAKVYRGGHFNSDVLVWDATTFTVMNDQAATDARRLNAFNGAPAPTQIVIGFNKYHRKT